MKKQNISKYFSGNDEVQGGVKSLKNRKIVELDSNKQVT